MNATQRIYQAIMDHEVPRKDAIDIATDNFYTKAKKHEYLGRLYLAVHVNQGTTEGEAKKTLQDADLEELCRMIIKNKDSQGKTGPRTSLFLPS